MSLFKRSIIAEIVSHGGVVFSTLIVVWLSVLLVRLLGEAAQGVIGADIVLGLAAFSSITALPTILAVSLFIAVLVAISRNYRESEMVVWFTAGQSLTNWLAPILTVAVPVCAVIALLTIEVSPWAYRQVEEYRIRYEQRSDFSKVATGQFIETNAGQRVFFIEKSDNPDQPLGNVFARVIDKDGWEVALTASAANFRIDDKGNRYIDLYQGNRYDLKANSPAFRVVQFNEYTMQLINKDTHDQELIRAGVLNKLKARPMSELLRQRDNKSNGQIMWRISLPWASLNLAILAIPLGAVNPRMGRSGNLILAGLIALLYMNLINLMRGWIGNGQVSFMAGTVGLNCIAILLIVYFFWQKMRIKSPKPPLVSA